MTIVINSSIWYKAILMQISTNLCRESILEKDYDTFYKDTFYTCFGVRLIYVDVKVENLLIHKIQRRLQKLLNLD